MSRTDQATPVHEPSALDTTPHSPLTILGHQLLFFAKALGSTYRAASHYRHEVLRLLAEVSMGTGALAVIGGTVVVVAFLTFGAGAVVGLQGFTALQDVGVEAFAGFVSAYVNTREVAPAIAGVGLAATIGAGFTAQLGAMRISEEVDALEVMAIPSLVYLVSTRIVAGFVAIIPLYSIAVIMSYASTRVVVTVFFGQSAGAYGHYFEVFLIPQDVLWSFAKALLMATVVMLVHCYYGFYASGGPVGVGTAVGRAVRTSLVAVMMIDLVMGLAVYGNSDMIRIAG